MRVFYGVYLQDDKSPMALFIREDWAIDFQRRMNKKNPAVTLYVRPTQRAVDVAYCACIEPSVQTSLVSNCVRCGKSPRN